MGTCTSTTEQHTPISPNQPPVNMSSLQLEAQPKVSKMSISKWASPPRKVEEDVSEEENEILPLPDVVLCSALSANILHGQRIRERRRHKATIQTKGREHLEETPLDQLMEPLVKSLEGLLSSTTISMNPDPTPVKEEEVDGGCVFHTKRRRTISTSSTATASKLSTLSAVVQTSSKLKKDSALTVTIEDTPEGVFNGLRSLFKNVFAN